jgi:hypothetical protein
VEIGISLGLHDKCVAGGTGTPPHSHRCHLRISIDFKLSPYSDSFQDSGVNSGVGGGLYFVGSVARDSENYNIFLQNQKQSN